MKRSEFSIGKTFHCGGKRWRCTDIGTRVVAICLEAHEVVSIDTSKAKTDPGYERRRVTDDPSWFNGPPYAVEERVFDEDAMRSCSTAPAA